MTRSQRLRPVQDLAGRAVSQQARQLAQVQLGLQQAEQKLQQLTRFHADYLAGLREREQGRVDLRHLQEGRQFLLKLGEAIQLQTQEVRRIEAQLAAARRQLLQAQQTSRSYDDLVAGYRAQEQRDSDRRQQAQADDLASQQFVWRQRPPGA